MSSILTPDLWFGTSGLVLPVPNKQAFPEAFRAGSRLTFYASLFNSLEVNSSFYKVPLPSTFQKWAGEVPDSFCFTVKLWRNITHEPDLLFSPADVDKFMAAADQLGPKKGCLLIQLPPSLKVDKKIQLERLLEQIDSQRTQPAEAQHPNTWRLAVEFRNPSWYRTDINRLLQRFNAARVLHDMPASRIMETTGDIPFVYLRFHGPAGDYKGGYGETVLEHYATMIRDWQDEGKEIFVYFNNTMGDAISDLRILRAMSTGHPTT